MFALVFWQTVIPKYKSAQNISSELWYSQIWNHFTWEIAYHSNVKPTRNGQEKANLEILCWIHNGHFCVLLSKKYKTFFPTKPIKCFFLKEEAYMPRWSPNKGVRPNPFMLARVTNVLTSSNLNIEFSTGSNRTY